MNLSDVAVWMSRPAAMRSNTLPSFTILWDRVDMEMDFTAQYAAAVSNSWVRSAFMNQIWGASR